MSRTAKSAAKSPKVGPWLIARVTPAQKSRVQANAKTAGVPVAEYIRIRTGADK